MDKLNFFYANTVVSGFSPVDFTIVLQRRGITNDQVPASALPMPTAPVPKSLQMETVILERLDVTLVPSNMKVLVATVVESLAVYEAQYGNIPLAAPDQARFDASISKLHDALQKS